MRTSIFSLLLLVICANLFMNCKPSQLSQNQNPFKDAECPFERLNWMKVTNTYSKTKVANLAAQIGAAASANASQIKQIASGNANASFGDSLTKTVDNITKDSVEVSQEFYEACQKQRIVVCQMVELMKNINIKKDVAFMSKLEDQYLNVTTSFATVKADEEKKNQQ